MNLETARALLRGLLDRLEADAHGGARVFGALVSTVDREAIRVALEALDEGVTAPARAVPSQVTPLEPVPAAASPAAPSAPPMAPEPPPQAPAVLRGASIDLDRTALTTKPDAHSDVRLCIDFGTARSKAAAARHEDDGARVLDIAIGRRADEPDGAIYSVSSSVWISDTGLVFAGAEAVRQSRKYMGSDRRRLDSLKQEISQAQSAETAAQALPKDINPTSVVLSYADAVTLYLAYVLDLATSELQERHGESRYTVRRFTLPCWRPEQRVWATPLLGRAVGKAQVLADTFSGRWQGGLPIDEVRDALNQLEGEQDSVLQALLDRAVGPWGRILEPLAAGSARVWSSRRETRALTAVVDVGAGTTDYSLFWLRQSPGTDARVAFPVKPEGHVLRMAGDTLDIALKGAIYARAQERAGERVAARTRFDIDLGIRGYKERLLNEGVIEIRLGNDDRLRITRDEFLQADQVRNFERKLEGEFEAFLGEVDASWATAGSDLHVVFTGGGASLPMVKALSGAPRRLRNGSVVASRSVPALPDDSVLALGADLAAEYPQLAVAIGGALPQILEEGKAQVAYMGAPAQGPLQGYRG